VPGVVQVMVAGFYMPVKDDGCVIVGETLYDAGQSLGGRRRRALRVNAVARGFVWLHGSTERRRVPIKGLLEQALRFNTSTEALAAQTRTDVPASRTATALSRRPRATMTGYRWGDEEGKPYGFRNTGPTRWRNDGFSQHRLTS
jgi:hypothetical protein